MFSSYIVWYLFLAGVGSGSFIVATASVLWDFWKQTTQSDNLVEQAQNGFVIAAVSMLSALLFLLLDLGVPERIWFVIATPFASIVSLGAWFVALFTFVSCSLALCIFLMKSIPKALLWLSYVAGTVLALCTMTYTGLLLSDMVSIDFWYTWLIPVLFIVSSLSTGSAAILGSSIFFRGSSKEIAMPIWHFSAAIAIVEVAVLSIFLADRFGFSDAARASCASLLLGDYLLLFWLGVCFCGLFAPLLIHFIYGKITSPALVLVASGGVLIGGVCLRYCIVGAALYTPLVLGFFP